MNTAADAFVETFKFCVANVSLCAWDCREIGPASLNIKYKENRRTKER